MRVLLITLFCFTGILFSVSAYAQAENEQVYVQGKKYLDLNIRSLDKYAKRLERTQKHLLSKLKRKEQRLARKLLRTDSAAYTKFRSQPLSFDSISRLAFHPDSTTLAARSLKGGQKVVDSLKGVYKFLQSTAFSASGNKELNQVAGLAGYSQELNGLQGRLSYDQYITELISSHTNNLQGIAGNTNMTGISKEVFYAKSKIKEWKKLADDPSKMEEMALEYLQGTKGFDLSMDKAINGTNNSMSNATSADELEKMGFQTRQQLNTALQQKFGNNLQAVQGSVSKDVTAWQDKAHDIQGQVKETKQSFNSLKKTEKPKFKINPERGKPFWQRIEKQYSFNTSRASTLADGTNRPALLTLAASAAYKHTPKLSTGIGIAGDIGLGQNWSSIRFTFEGIGVRGFVTWEWQYGIGAYGGFERTWKRAVFQSINEQGISGTNTSVHSTSYYTDAALIGLFKKYKVNSQWNGAVQVLYDVWWEDKGLRTPIIIRFLNSK